jgi:acyl-CoA hydrolase
MKHYKLVLPEFMNEQEALFGGNLLKWIDEFAYVTVSLDHPGNRFVTVSLDNVVFRKPIKVGYILCFNVVQSQLGNTSVGYKVKVFNAKEDAGGNNLLFETRIVFVNVDKTGKKQKIKNSKRITESRKA